MLRTPPRPRDRTALREAALLAGTAAMLLAKAGRGELVFYIHPRFTPLAVACGLLLLLMAGARLVTAFGRVTEPAHGRRGSYLLVALPVLLGLLLPARPLEAGALAGKGLGTSGAIRPAAPLAADSRQWNVLQWATAINVRGAEVQGQEAEVVGFVYHDPARPLDGFVVVRHVIICRTADGSGVGLPVVWAGGTDLTVDSWVRVRGRLGTALIDGHPEPALLADTVEPVPRPANPYLYA